MKTIKNVLAQLFIAGCVLCVNCNRGFNQRMGVRSDHDFGDGYIILLNERSQDTQEGRGHDHDKFVKFFEQEGLEYRANIPEMKERA